MTLTPRDLQEQQTPWVLHNFGPGQPHQPLLGMIEELGELGHAIDDWHVANVCDSLADFVVFCSDYCTKRGWDFARVFPTGVRVEPSINIDTSLRGAFLSTARAAHCQLKTEQQIRGTPEKHAEDGQQALRCALLELEAIAQHFGWTLMGVTEPVWAKVKQRDFKKNALNGGEVQSP